MRRLASIAIALVLALCITACGSSGTPDPAKLAAKVVKTTTSSAAGHLSGMQSWGGYDLTRARSRKVKCRGDGYEGSDVAQDGEIVYAQSICTFTVQLEDGSVHVFHLKIKLTQGNGWAISRDEMADW